MSYHVTDVTRGVDNSISMIHYGDGDTEATMLLEELPTPADEYSTSAKLPQHLNSIRTLSKSTNNSSKSIHLSDLPQLHQ